MAEHNATNNNILLCLQESNNIFSFYRSWAGILHLEKQCDEDTALTILERYSRVLALHRVPQDCFSGFYMDIKAMKDIKAVLTEGENHDA